MNNSLNLYLEESLHIKSKIYMKFIQCIVEGEYKMWSRHYSSDVLDHIRAQCWEKYHKHMLGNKAL